MKLVKPQETPTVNTLLYGPPKTGKSTAAGTVPGGVLYLNADLPNATRFVHQRNPGGRIMELALPTADEGPEALMKVLAEVANEVSKGATDGAVIDSVVVDPVGELHRRMLEQASNRSVRPSLPTYGDVSTHLERFCRFLCEAPVNVVLVAHEYPVKNDSTGEVDILPYTGTTNPALGQKLLGMVDVVGYTGVIEQQDGTKTYAAQLFPAKGRRGGDRFNVLGDVRPLDLAEWINVIHESQKHELKEAA